MQLAWKLSRLRAMGPAEIGYRISQTVRTALERRGYGLARPGPVADKQGRPWLSGLPRGFSSARYCKAADEILQGRFSVFALDEVSLGFPPRWNRDPKTGVEAPLEFGKTLNYRDERIVGNIKYLWEINRHLELVTLAQAWHLSAEDRYARGCRTLLDSWLQQCPYPSGQAWVSSLELGIRLLNWGFAWQLLGGSRSSMFQDAEGRALRQRWLTAVYQHCHFIASYWSRYSSANNHLLGEALGLYVAATIWPLWPESAAWRRHGHDLFQAECLLQNAPDGVNREQGVWYHHEVADMMLLALVLAKANGDSFTEEFALRLERMLEFIASLMDVAGNVPAWGDADDAVMVRFVPTRNFPVYRSLLATGAVWFKRADFALRAGGFDDKSRWLLGDAAATEFAALEGSASVSAPERKFPDGGYYILGEDFAAPAEVRIVADAAPLGYLSIAAHGHADALSFTLSVAGCPMLIDPGTYAYHTDKKWRDYFRGTSAHNTLRVDELDQSVPAGNFLWLRHARATCERFETSDACDLFAASHDGYARLGDPVIHRRKLRYQHGSRVLVIDDSLSCSSEHLVEMFWHFSPACDVVCSDRAATIACGEVHAVLEWPDGATATVVKGRDSPPLGWSSPSFDIKIPSPTLVVRLPIRGPWSGTTSLRLKV